MLLKYANINTHLGVYNKYFNQVMQDLNKDNDRCKMIYVLKMDMKKFQENFQIDSEFGIFGPEI